MSAPAGVLAAMSRASNALARVDVDDILRADLIAARAAVAELTEAAKRIRLGYDFDTPVVIGLADLHSALAQVQGGEA